MESNSHNSDIDSLNLENRLRGRWVVQQELGKLRSFASRCKSIDNSIDEESLFKALAQNWIEGVKVEIAKLFEPEKATELLDVWHRSKV